MTDARGYGESVLFAFVKNGLVLCEIREWDDEVMDSIPGGRVAPKDRTEADYLVAALVRETAEELDVVPTAYQLAGQVWYEDRWLFTLFVVRQWHGELPEAVLDTGKALHWVHPDDLVDNTHMLGLADLIRRTL